jgi:hypothetical protein
LKRLIAVLALALFALPASSLASSPDMRTHDPSIQSSSLGIPPRLAAKQEQLRAAAVVAPRLPAQGTDVAASDQQSSPAGVPESVPATGGSDFDWGDAGIGAGSAICLLAVCLASAMTLRRRRFGVAG